MFQIFYFCNTIFFLVILLSISPPYLHSLGCMRRGRGSQTSWAPWAGCAGRRRESCPCLQTGNRMYKTENQSEGAQLHLTPVWGEPIQTLFCAPKKGPSPLLAVH